MDEDKLHWLDDFEPFCRGPLKVIGSPNNEALLAATQWVIGNSTMDLVLFLEKDWQILETAEATTKRLDDGERRPNQEMQNTGFDGLSTVTLIMRRVVLCVQYLRRRWSNNRRKNGLMTDKLARSRCQISQCWDVFDKRLLPSSSCRQDASRVRHRPRGSVQAQNKSREPALLPGDLPGKLDALNFASF